MNQEEIQVLNNIKNNQTISQRELSHHTGLSLGTVNILLNKMVKKGIIKIERMSARTLKYILTPQGIKEKADATYNYVKNTYRKIQEVHLTLDKIINEINIENKIIVLIGNDDEIKELLENRLKNTKQEYIAEYKPEDLIKSTDKVIICWSTEAAEMLTENGISHYNIMESL